MPVPTSLPTPEKKRKRAALVNFSAVAAVSFALDYATKLWALKTLTPAEEQPLIGNLITLKLIFNPGAAFSFLSHATWVFTIFTIIVLLLLPLLMRKVTSHAWSITFGLVGGGAAGNLLDRLTQPPGFAVGHVVDFLNWNDWFIGNVADIWIVVAATIAFILVVKDHPFNPETTPETSANKDTAAHE